MTTRHKFKYWWRKALISLRLRRPATLELRWTSTHPTSNSVRDGELLVVGVDGQYQKWAYLKCPCRCGKQLRLSLSRHDSPAWTVTVADDGLATVEPSVRQVNDCYAHFWLRNGEVDWCSDSGLPPRFQ